MSFLTIVTIGAILGSVFWRRGLSGALAVGGATPAGACLIAGPIVVPTFYGVGAVALVVVLSATLFRPKSAPKLRWVPGLPLLLVFLAYASLTTIISPFLFDGLPIVTPMSAALRAGVVTTSNLAQIAYLLIGIGVVAYLARSRVSDPAIIGIAAGASLYLSAWRYAFVYFGVPFPEGVFDNSPNFTYIQTAAGGADRFRGIFSEPSALATTCLVALVYFVLALRNARGGRRVLSLITIALALFLGVVSTSTTFVVAGLILIAIAVAVTLVRFVTRRSAVSTAAAVLGCLTLIVGVYSVPLVVGAVQYSVSSKLGASSYEDRSNADTESFRVFLDTWGIGAGLGAGRGSSMMPTLLSTVGLIGTLLFIAVIVLLLLKSAGSVALRPAIWTLVALLVCKLVSGPDLADPTGTIWICLGLLANKAAGSARWPNRLTRAPARGLAVQRG